MEWLSQSEHQGIAALIAILQIIFTVVQYRGPAASQLVSMPTRIIQGIVLLVIGWVIYAIPWALLAFSMRSSPSMVLSPEFFVLSAFAVLGALSTKSSTIGGFIGGSVPLATLTLFYLSTNPNMQKTAPPLAWFGMCMMLGGLLGALTGPTAIEIIQAIKPQTLAWHTRGKKKLQDSHFSMPFNTNENTMQKNQTMKLASKKAPIFISYAHEDNASPDPSKRYLDRLLEQLYPLVVQDQVYIWSDKNLEMGEDWHKTIQIALANAKAAVLFVSPSFLASDYVRNSELPILLHNAKQNGTTIISIILRPCLFSQVKFKYPDPVNGPEEFSLASLQAANLPDQPLNSLTEHEQDRILLSVAKRLFAIFQQ